MRLSLLIYLHADNQISWATFDTAGRLINSATHVPLNTLPRHNSPPLVLIPGTEILLTQTNIPSKQLQKIVQAIPYALEEQLAENVENLHFALGKREPQSGNLAVAVIARSKMDTYLEQLGNTGGIMPRVLMPDILAVPKPADGWGILYLNDIVLVRTDLHAGFAIEPDCLNTALQMALIEEANPPEQITIFSGTESAATLPDLGIPVTEKTHEQGVLAWLAQGLIDNNPLNLLQGNYSSQSSSLRPWLLTAILLLLWGGLYAGQQWIEYQQLSQQRQALNTQIKKIYRDTFPEARKIVNPRVQMEQRLKALRAQLANSTTDENFLYILNKISTPRTPGFNLKRIDYRQGRFDIQLEVVNLQALENLKQQLSNLGLTVKIQSAISRNKLIKSRLQIKGKS